jgi:hypothetical protein
MILTATMLFACKDDDETASGGSATLEISDADKSHSFDLNGGSKTVNVTASAMFTVEMKATDWLTVSEIGKTGFKINADANANIESRSAKLILLLKDAENIEIEVSQAAGSSTLTADRQTVAFNSGANETVISINSTAYTATASVSWLTATASGTKLRISAERNTNDEERSGQITVHVDGFQDVTLTVRQAAYLQPTLSIDPQSLEFGYFGGEQTVALTTNWQTIKTTVANGGDWITVRIDGSNLTVEANYNFGARRNTTVTLSADDLNVVLNVTQEMSEERTVDGDGYVVVNQLPRKDYGNYKRNAVQWRGTLGLYTGPDYGGCGILAYKINVTGSGKLKITDHKSPTWNIWLLLFDDKGQADEGNDASITSADGTIEYDVTPGTYYVFGILNVWYDDVFPYEGDIDYEIEISLSE